MKTFTHNGSEYGLVEVPKEAHDFRNDLASHQIDYCEESQKILFEDCVMVKEWWGKPIQIIGKASELTYEQTNELVDKVNPVVFKDYVHPVPSEDHPYLGFYTAIESLHSRIKFLGLKPETTLIIKLK